MDFMFGSSKITADGDCSHEIKRGLLLGRKAMTNLDSILKSRDITFMLTKVHIVKAMVVMCGCELDHEEGCAPKNWCFWTMVLEKSFESRLDCKEIKPVNTKGNQPWIFIERTDAEVEAPILWLLDVKNQLNRKVPDAGKGWRQKEKRATVDEIIGLNHQLNGHEFEQTTGDSEGQGSLVCYNPRGHKDLDTT